MAEKQVNACEQYCQRKDFEAFLGGILASLLGGLILWRLIKKSAQGIGEEDGRERI